MKPFSIADDLCELLRGHHVEEKIGPTLPATPERVRAAFAALEANPEYVAANERIRAATKAPGRIDWSRVPVPPDDARLKPIPKRW